MTRLETLGTEEIGVLPQAGLTVDGVGADDHEVPLGDGRLSESIRPQSTPIDHPDRRIEPQGFHEDHAEALEAVDICEGGSLSGEFTNDFLPENFLLLWMPVKKVPDPGKGIGGGFMPGDQHRHHLVAQLPIRHCFPRLLILR